MFSNQMEHLKMPITYSPTYLDVSLTYIPTHLLTYILLAYLPTYNPHPTSHLPWPYKLFTYLFNIVQPT
jgi:hypothetical protein